MERRQYLAAAGTVALGTGLAGCLGGNGSGDSTGTLATQVTDQPGDIGDFDSCVITITEIRVKPAGNDEGTTTGTTADETGTDEEDGDDEDGEGEERIDVDDAEADLVQLQDGETQLVSEAELETGEYEHLKLAVSNVDAERSDGGDAEVDTPGNAPLKFNESFEVRADTRTTFTADFTPVKRGQQDSYILKPVADGVEVEYESGTEAGTATATSTE